MTRFQFIAFLPFLYSLPTESLGLRSVANNSFVTMPVHRRLASCPATTGIDYIGNDIKHVSGLQVSECCPLCSQTTTCGAFTWTTHLGGTCWLKSAKGDVATNAAAISAVLEGAPASCTLKDNIDYQGNDIANVQSSNAGTCCSVCSTWPGCSAFSWSNQNGGTCWLKSKSGIEVVKSGIKSAVVQNTAGQCTLQYDVDFANNNIGNSPGRDPGDCCGLCNNWSGCRSFSWTNLNGGTCWLKSAKGESVYKSGVVSSQLMDNPLPKCNLEANVDYGNNDIGNVPGSYPGDCCDKCRTKTGCHAFTWSNYNGGTCWLKSGKESTTFKSGVTSAVVF